MSTDETREATIQAASAALAKAVDAENYRWAPLYDHEAQTLAKAAVTAAAPLIEAAVRERDAVTLRSVLDRHQLIAERQCDCGAHGEGRWNSGHILDVLSIELVRAAAIARTTPTTTGTSKEQA